MTFAHQVLESKDEKLQRKLQTAMDYAKNICIFGSSNKIKNALRTNAWSLRQRYRYNVSGNYLKFSEGKFSAKEDSWPNVVYDSQARKFTYKTLNTVYDSIQKKFVFKKIEWYYHPDKTTDNIDFDFEIFDDNLNPLDDPKFNLNPSLKFLLLSCMATIARRQGNCGSLAELIGKYLWEHPEGIKSIEGITTATFDHEFVIVNRCGELKKPETWGDAWIIDAWYGKKGIIFHAREFKEKIEKIKKFSQNQIESLTKLGMKFKCYIDQGNDIDKCRWEIKPSKDQYPSYSYRLLIEDYYIFKNSYPKIFQEQGVGYTLQKEFEEHQRKFKKCLEQINPSLIKKGIQFFPTKNSQDEEELNVMDIMSQTINGLNSVVKESISANSKKSKTSFPEDARVFKRQR